MYFARRLFGDSQAKRVVVQKVGRLIRPIHATGEQKVRSAQTCAERAHGIFWIVLFRVRLFIFMVFGYDPWILNWDQSPFHHNESGAQNKPTLGIKGSTVPVVRATPISSLDGLPNW